MPVNSCRRESIPGAVVALVRQHDQPGGGQLAHDVPDPGGAQVMHRTRLRTGRPRLVIVGVAGCVFLSAAKLFNSRTVMVRPVGPAEDLVREQAAGCRPLLAGWELRVPEFLGLRKTSRGVDDEDLLNGA